MLLCWGPRPGSEVLQRRDDSERRSSPGMGAGGGGRRGSGRGARESEGGFEYSIRSGSIRTTSQISSRKCNAYLGDAVPSMTDGISFGSIPESRYEEVIEHLRNNFFADEPLNYSVSLCRPGEPHAELEEHSLTTLRDGLSQMAVHDDTGQIIGVALNGVQRPGDISSARDKLSSMTDEKFRSIFEMLYGLNEELDLFKEHEVEKIFECRILSVDNRFRGRGLARELLLRSEQTARENGFKVLKEDATGLFSQRVAESLGLSTVRELRYSDYTNAATGEPMFQPPAPHEYLKIMVKLL